jgi:cold shock CspA family protein
VVREDTGEVKYQSEILSMKSGYGFIKYPNNNLFFYHEDVEDIDFNDLREGDEVEFTIANNSEGKSLAKNVRRIY